ncbi:MAG: GAF domain-containing protein [Cyclobacteriaceae bacterium]|nr:GAF domain-containing protein [Cyclobacteriaceae bacterium]
MKFRHRSLKQLGALLLVSMALIYFCEFLVIRYKINSLKETEEKKDFARSAQLGSQQIALQVQRYLSGHTDLSADITARIKQQDRDLEILKNGGRKDNSTIFLKPLSRLPRISFDNLFEDWSIYKESTIVLITESEFIETALPSSTDSTETTSHTVQVPNINYTKAKITNGGHWLTLSGWFEKLLKDINDEVLQKEQAVAIWFLIFVAVDIALLGAIAWLFFQHVLKPISGLAESTQNLQQQHDLPPNEIGKLATQINIILEQLKDATEFITTIGDGKLDVDYQALDSHYEAGKSKLADSLVAMQLKLKSLNDEERKRQWANEGLAKFVDILRSSNDDISQLSDSIIAALVKYTNSNQGGLYSFNDEDENNTYLELVSLFAFDTKKFEKKRVKPGEGILGQSFLERETTLLTEIPDNYVRITSGLGDATPKSILMVPLKVDQQVYGMVELASFHEYQPHEISFVERLGETIASTLANVKGAQKNRHLIEQFQQQTEEMRAQEEEMRQNMEELTATQEEMSRKEHDYIARIAELESQAGSQSVDTVREELKKQFRASEAILKNKIVQLEEQLSIKPAHSDDWALVEEVEKSLKINLEAIKITQEELDRKAG